MLSVSFLLLVFAALLATVLLLYGSLFLLTSLRFLFLKSEPLLSAPHTEKLPSVTVAVPAHLEGEGILGLLESLREQDYQGQLDIFLLFEDFEDPSFHALQEYLSLETPSGQKRISSEIATNRKLTLVACGTKRKREKLNLLLSEVETEFIAVLDADHRAREDWIALSIKELLGRKISAVQARRSPLALNRIAQVWDSAQNHVGNEATSELLANTFGTTFFTGTTCVFKTDSLKRRNFNECVTEDTFLSYEMILAGERIAFLPGTGSREEVAPTLASYIRRRRRWANGHTKTFLSFLPKILIGSSAFKIKLLLLLHGAFFLLPTLALGLLGCLASFTFLQLTGNLQQVILCATFLLALLLLYICGLLKSWRAPRDLLVAWIVCWAVCMLWVPIALHYNESELYYALLSFPYEEHTKYLQLFCVAAPLVGVLINGRKIAVLHLGQEALLVLTYPFLLILDVFACTLGIVDLLLRKSTWQSIERTFEEENLEAELKSANQSFVRRAGVSTLVVCASLLILNEYGAVSSCGKIIPLLAEPVLREPEDLISWDLQYEKQITDNGELIVRLHSSFEGGIATDAELTHSFDRNEKTTVKLLRGKEVSTEEYTRDLGWENFHVQSLLKADGVICLRNQGLSSSVVEAKERDLLINGEPFLIKGVIPSFFNAHTQLPSHEGFRQIKSLGANTLRLYHHTPDITIRSAKENDLLVIDQPTASTWSKRDVSTESARRKLRSDFSELWQKHRADFTRLFPLFGNELELFEKDTLVEPLVDLLRQVRDEDHPLFGYATYFTYVNYPSSILAINMLDSGGVYWNSALDLMSRYRKPVFAGELGGVVAFSERTPSSLRTFRLIEQWQDLLDSGFAGAVIYQSHDNWAQPVPIGFNDPLSGEQPDDARGIWDRDNRPKPILKVVTDLFNDIEMFSEQSGNSIITRLRNRRRYTLSNIRVRNDNGRIVQRQTELLPGESFTLSLSEPLPSPGTLKIEYLSHQGLPGVSTLAAPQYANIDRPYVLNADFLETDSTSNVLKGRLQHSDVMKLVAPRTWKLVEVGGKEIANTGELLEIPIRSPRRAVQDFKIRKAGEDWGSLSDNVTEGEFEFQFRMPAKVSDSALLILEGLGTEAFTLSGEGNSKEMRGHRYREVLIPVSELSAEQRRGVLNIKLNRDRTTYIHKNYHPFRENVDISLRQPWIFEPTEISVRGLQ